MVDSSSSGSNSENTITLVVYQFREGDEGYRAFATNDDAVAWARTFLRDKGTGATASVVPVNGRTMIRYEHAGAGIIRAIGTWNIPRPFVSTK